MIAKGTRLLALKSMQEPKKLEMHDYIITSPPNFWNSKQKVAPHNPQMQSVVRMPLELCAFKSVFTHSIFMELTRPHFFKDLCFYSIIFFEQRGEGKTKSCYSRTRYNNPFTFIPGDSIYLSQGALYIPYLTYKEARCNFLSQNVLLAATPNPHSIPNYHISVWSFHHCLKLYPVRSMICLDKLPLSTLSGSHNLEFPIAVRNSLNRHGRNWPYVYGEYVPYSWVIWILSRFIYTARIVQDRIILKSYIFSDSFFPLIDGSEDKPFLLCLQIFLSISIVTFFKNCHEQFFSCQRHIGKAWDKESSTKMVISKNETELWKEKNADIHVGCTVTSYFALQECSGNCTIAVSRPWSLVQSRDKGSVA